MSCGCGCVHDADPQPLASAATTPAPGPDRWAGQRELPVDGLPADEHPYDDHPAHEHPPRPHPHDHPPHPHPHPHPAQARSLELAPALEPGRLPLDRGGAPRRVQIEENLLVQNDRVAAENRSWLSSRRIVALNLVSSPGAGKTSLLERTLSDLARQVPMAVIEGDQASTRDRDRIRVTGCPAIQINTGAGCHLDATMVAGGLDAIPAPKGGLLFIENVGNLVCPALFDLGEQAKVLVMSVTEGDDKPLKYPYMFRESSLLVLNKIDLLPHVPFDPHRCVAHARQLNPRLQVLAVSALRGDGLQGWYAWLATQVSRQGQR